MKILNLYFKNVNSLEGESRINFDKAPLVNGGVFAITGPNGSGKSSILDAITLGLYGETFRFDRPAKHVMTKSTADSFSEVEFALDQDKYKATWHVAREGGSAAGELLPAEMQLIKIGGTETVLETDVQKVREKMLELTGMDFHKFSKSMVLAQGDFSAFLNALDSERMDILEKISGADIYQEYRQQAEEKHTQALARQQNLEQDFSATPLMDETAVEASEHDLTDFKEQHVELKAELDDVGQQLQWVRNIADLEKQAESLDKQQQKATAEQAQNQEDLDKIEISKKVLVFEEELSLLDSKADEIEQSKKTLVSYRNEAEMLQKQVKTSHEQGNVTESISAESLSTQKVNIEAMTVKLSDLKYALSKETDLIQTLEQQKEQKSTDLLEVESWLQKNSGDKALLENFPDMMPLKKLKDELLDIEVKQKSNSKWSSSVTTGISKKKEEVIAIKAKNKQLKETIAKNEAAVKEMTDGKSLQELQELHLEQKERALNFQELHDLATVNEKLGNKGFFGRFFSVKEDVEEQELKSEHDLLTLEIGKEKVLIATLEAAVINENLLKKMAADRAQLVDGKACSLCGSLDHPFVQHMPAASNSTSVLKEQTKKIKTLQADEVSLRKKIVVAKANAEKSLQKDDKLKNVRSQWNVLANRLNAFSLDLTIDNLSLMKTLVKDEKIALSELNKLLKQTNKLQESIKQAEQKLPINEATLERVNNEIEGLNVEWDNRPQDVVEIDDAYKKAAGEEKVLSEKVTKQLEVLGESMPKKGKEDAFFKKLDARKQEYARQTKNLKLLTEDLEKVGRSINEGLKKVAEIKPGIQQCTEEAQQQESAGMHIALIEKQKMVADKETAFAQQEVEVASLKQGLLDKIKETANVDLSGLRESLAFIQSEERIQDKQSGLIKTVFTLKDMQEAIKVKLDAEQALAVTDLSEYDLTGKQGVIKRKLDIAKQEVVSLQNKLDKQGSLQQKRDDLLTEMVTHKKELEASEAEIKLVTSGDNIDFRRKAQHVISDQLMSQTNQVLEKISGRYYVRKAESEHGLALEIEDTKQKNARRLPKTLSGGESFIVSLALALGLAEMSSKEHALDSLFIDEGFGNLDAESLYLAMTALESLQTHGKVVGVISHIEGVQKRIKTQIEMIKKPNGLSALKMVS